MVGLFFIGVGRRAAIAGWALRAVGIIFFEGGWRKTAAAWRPAGRNCRGTERHLPVCKILLPIVAKHLSVCKILLSIVAKHLSVRASLMSVLARHLSVCKILLPIVAKHLPVFARYLSVCKKHLFIVPRPRHERSAPAARAFRGRDTHVPRSRHDDRVGLANDGVLFRGGRLRAGYGFSAGEAVAML